MSVKSSSSQGEPAGGGAVVRAGYLKKLKTSKKKYFVLRAESCESSARLEYYDSEKKFNAGQAPKRSIQLKTCFNINKRHDTKHKHVIALYTKIDCFCVVLETEEELDAWLKALLSHQQGEEVPEGEMPRPTFEHVWQVTLLNRGTAPAIFGYNKNSDTSIYRLCLTDKTLSLIRKDCDTPRAELSLSSIRSCGSLKNYFYLEAGRSSGIGAGELWMETEDHNIAQNVHQTVFHAMTSNSSSREELTPRNRTISLTESSKPINLNRRRDTLADTPKPIPHQQGFADCRARCDSMPSRPRTTSEGWDRVFLVPHRPQSLHARDISHSPPSGSPVTPPSAACSTDSAGSSLSIDESEPWHDVDIHRTRFPTSLTPDEAIAEENCDDCTDGPCVVHSSPTPGSYVPMAPISSDDGYVDMSPGGRHATMSPAASMSSVTSGTPSTDMRFAEYPLEKVSSYFTPSEDDETSSAERPRTYSMGSRPFKSRKEQARDRAWSAGSKSKKVYNRVLPPHGPHVHPGVKSSSAPMLSNSRYLSSHSSIDPMDDLMEMDFSKKTTTSSAGDVKQNKIPPGYVDMRPGCVEKPPDTQPYVDMRPGSSPAKPLYIQSECGRDFTRPDYVDMENKRVTRMPISPLLMMSKSPTSSHHTGHTDYLDMNSQPKTYSQYDMYTASPVKSTLSGYSHGSPSMMDYMDVTPGASQRYDVTPGASQRYENEGYVEMSLGKGASGDYKGASGDYTNMSMGSKKKERKGKKETARSEPITIQNAIPAAHDFYVTGPIYNLLVGRKNSTGTPPKMNLPLQSSSYSSLPRQQRSRKNSSRRDSKDSSSSSITTPSSSSTIFPFSLNSPSSPVYPISKSPTGRLQNDRQNDYTVMDFDKKTPPTYEYMNFDPAVRKPADSGDYAVMFPGTKLVTAQMRTLDLNESNRCFKPINDGKEDVGDDSRTPESRLGSRPGSENKLSRPSSENSEAGSTTSTLVGSRPGSVNSESTRPGDGQLHYASLDLAAIGDEEASKSPRTAKPPSSDDVSPASNEFTYAEIDFVRSEGLKNNQLLNAKIKH